MQEGCNRYTISMHGGCNRYAISIQERCKWYTISMHGGCNWYAISMQRAAKSSPYLCGLPLPDGEVRQSRYQEGVETFKHIMIVTETEAIIVTYYDSNRGNHSYMI